MGEVNCVCPKIVPDKKGVYQGAFIDDVISEEKVGKFEPPIESQLKPVEPQATLAEQPEPVERSNEEVRKKSPLEAGTEGVFIENVIIYMQNGHIVRGRIKQETDKKIILEIKTGRTPSAITFHKSKIKKIKRFD